MTFQEILDLTKNRINETDIDPQIDIILKNAINYAYGIIATEVDKITKTVTLTKGSTMSLPSDFYSLVYMYGGFELTEQDYDVKANLLIPRNSDIGNTIDLTYIYYPPRLIYDNDNFLIKDIFSIALSIYGHYAYMMFKKRTDVASVLLNEFNLLIKQQIELFRGDKVDTKRNN